MTLDGQAGKASLPGTRAHDHSHEESEARGFTSLNEINLCRKKNIPILFHAISLLPCRPLPPAT